MALVIDSGILYAYYDRDDSWHASALDLLSAEQGNLILPGPVIPEVDYLLGERLGSGARQTLYQGLIGGFFLIPELTTRHYQRIAALSEKLSDLNLSFVDAAVAALSESLKVPRIATLDRRDFAVLQSEIDFEILP